MSAENKTVITAGWNKLKSHYGKCCLINIGYKMSILILSEGRAYEQSSPH